ncbi:MAG: deoxyribose-phosphate aldolase [Anaerovoracaceae bacterium]|nr:deoxyribose-phosphate aldolase [Anaerovoracaceae bacterium]
MENLCRYIDHTLLKPEAGREEIARLCREAAEHNFYAVCVNSCHAAYAKSCLREMEKRGFSPVKLAVVAGFPLGACATEVKMFEADCACRAGADEIDMVINIGALKEGRINFVRDEITAVVRAAAKHGAIVKVILETCLLTEAEIRAACRLAGSAGAAFVKTSTGFSKGGATPETVALMKAAAGSHVRVKAAGGIRTRAQAESMIRAGADRIGTSSGIAIIGE